MLIEMKYNDMLYTPINHEKHDKNTYMWGLKSCEKKTHIKKTTLCKFK